MKIFTEEEQNEKLYTNKELGDKNRDGDNDDTTHGGVKTLKLSGLPSKDKDPAAYQKAKRDKEKMWKDKGYSGVRWESASSGKLDEETFQTLAYRHESLIEELGILIGDVKSPAKIGQALGYLFVLAAKNENLNIESSSIKKAISNGVESSLMASEVIA